MATTGSHSTGASSRGSYGTTGYCLLLLALVEHVLKLALQVLLSMGLGLLLGDASRCRACVKGRAHFSMVQRPYPVEPPVRSTCVYKQVPHTSAEALPKCMVIGVEFKLWWG